MKNFIKNFMNLFDEFDNLLFQDKEEDKRLSEEFKNRKLYFQVQNYKDIMNTRIIPFVRDKELTDSGILLTDEQLFERAHNIFCKAKQDGKIDELNRLIEVTRKKENEL